MSVLRSADGFRSDFLCTGKKADPDQNCMQKRVMAMFEEATDKTSLHLEEHVRNKCNVVIAALLSSGAVSAIGATTTKRCP